MSYFSSINCCMNRSPSNKECQPRSQVLRIIDQLPKIFNYQFFKG
jgi:hypothetical protein